MQIENFELPAFLLNYGIEIVIAIVIICAMMIVGLPILKHNWLQSPKLRERPVRKQDIETAYEFARERDAEEKLTRFLELVRAELGEAPLCIGHMFWFMDKVILNEDVGDFETLPRYSSTSKQVTDH